MIAKNLQENLKNASWIRKMFVEGTRLKAEFGAENVYDYSLGNPYFEPPKAVLDALKRATEDGHSGTHRYMDNLGYVETRTRIAERISSEMDPAARAPLGPEHIVMTVGAAGGLNVVLNTVLDPGDEVIVFAPYFAEYTFYIQNHRGVKVVVETSPETFQPDAQALERAITEKTKAVLINSPNNPSGVVYSEAVLKQMAAVLQAKSRTFGHPIFVIADEPYKALVYDGVQVPNVHMIFEHSIIVSSYSKSLGLAGERIGYIALNSTFGEALPLLTAGLSFSNRTLGFVNAPAIWQRVIAEAEGASVDIEAYDVRRRALYEPLKAMGYEMVKPQGAFYLFPKSLEADDVAFVMAAKKYNLLLVPGSGFGYPGHVRLSYCVDLEMIKRSLPAFEALMAAYKA